MPSVAWGDLIHEVSGPPVIPNFDVEAVAGRDSQQIRGPGPEIDETATAHWVEFDVTTSATAHLTATASATAIAGSGSVDIVATAEAVTPDGTAMASAKALWFAPFVVTEAAHYTLNGTIAATTSQSGARPRLPPVSPR